MDRSDPMPPEALLADYPPHIGATANWLRDVVRRAVPDAIERVRPGWRLIGYDILIGRRTAYFAFVWPEPEHAHLGFEHGVLLEDPDELLRGAELKLKRVRFVTCHHPRELPERALGDLVRAAAGLASLRTAGRDTIRRITARPVARTEGGRPPT